MRRVVFYSLIWSFFLSPLCPGLLLCAHCTCSFFSMNCFYFTALCCHHHRPSLLVLCKGCVALLVNGETVTDFVEVASFDSTVCGLWSCNATCFSLFACSATKDLGQSPLVLVLVLVLVLPILLTPLPIMANATSFSSCAE